MTHPDEDRVPLPTNVEVADNTMSAESLAKLLGFDTRKENEAAVRAAESALGRIFKAICWRDNSQAVRLRRITLGLYYGVPISFHEHLVCIDWKLRKDIVVVILAYNQGNFGDAAIREALIKAGDTKLVWFRRGLTEEEEISYR